MHDRRRGFTLVELTLAMAFMSMLLLAILTISIQAGKMYSKGVTYKTVNQVSRELTDTIRRDFQGANAGTIIMPVPAGTGTKLAGRVCTGAVTYIWNTANLINDSTVPSTQKVTDASGKPIVFRRVVDQGGTLCTNDALGKYPMMLSTVTESSELLSTEGRDLAAYDFSVKKIQSDTSGRGLYNVHMILGTNEQDTTTQMASGSYQCLPPTDGTANFDYCTVIEFDAMVRVGGGI